MKVLVIGSGGREHAIVDALSRSKKVEKIYCAPGNAGIAAQAECVPVKDTDVPALFGGGFGSTFEQAAEFAFGTSISPSYVMGLSSALSILREAGVDLLPDITFGLCDMWVVRILSFLWVALTMLGPVIGEEMEKINTKYVGPIMIFVFELIIQ